MKFLLLFCSFNFVNVKFSLQYKENQDAFQRTARHWTCAYAGAKHRSTELDEKIERITEMGFDEVRGCTSSFLVFVTIGSNETMAQMKACNFLDPHQNTY